MSTFLQKVHVFAIILRWSIIAKAHILGDSIKDDFERIKHYELIHFNLETNILEFEAFNQHYKLELTLRDHSLPTVINHPQRDHTLPSVDAPPHEPCHYKAKIIEPSDESTQWSSISTCSGRGVRAFIRLNNDQLIISPAQHYFDPYKEPLNGHHIHHQHLIYKQSHYDHPKLPKGHKSIKVITSGEKPVNSVNTAWENNEPQQNTRRRLPWDSNNVVEVYTLWDPSIVKEWKKKHGSSWYDRALSHWQDFINQASDEYENTDWDISGRSKKIGSFKLKWVRLDVVESFSGDFKDLENSDEYKYADNFIEYAEKKVRPKQNYDFGALYTYEGDGGAYAWTNGVCYKDWGYGMFMSSGNLSRQRKLMAHELGHSLDMQHDEKSECCESDGSCSDSCKYFCDDGNVMGDGDYNTNGFSSCSKKYLYDYMSAYSGLSCTKGPGSSFRSNKGGDVEEDEDPPRDEDPPQYEDPPEDDEDEGNGGECVKVKSLSINGKRFNGEWNGYGRKYDGKTSYKLDGWYLYRLKDDDDGDWYWTISDSLGKNTWEYGWCDKSDILDCDGDWDGYGDEGDTNCRFSSCSTLEGEIDSCLFFNTFGDTVCVYKNGISSDYTLYQVDVVEGCSNDKAVYRYDDELGVEYLHYSDAKRWVISRDNMIAFGSFMCENEDLLECVEGNWVYEKRNKDWISLKVHANMTVISCPINVNAMSNNTVSSKLITLIIVNVIIGFIIFGVIIFICYRWKKSSSKVKAEKVPDFEDEDQEIEIEAQMIVDASTNII